jgi:hypothetical protein
VPSRWREPQRWISILSDKETQREEIMTAPPATGKQPRFPQLTMDQLNEKQKPLGEQIMKISSTGIGGPYNAMLRSPVLAQRLFDLFDYLRWQTSVPTRLNEFAILIIGRQWRSQVEVRARADRDEGGAFGRCHRQAEIRQAAVDHGGG